MKISELVREWESSATGRMSATRYTIPLDVESAARLAALTEMYPKRSTEELLGELVGAALEGAPSCNGWTYWHFKREGKMIPIDLLRQQIRAELAGEVARPN